MIPADKQKEHIVNCILNTNVELIPCDECGEGIPFSDYENHSSEHAVKFKQIEEEKAATSKIPCDICGLEISFNQYEEHTAAHKNPILKPKQRPRPLVPETTTDQLEAPLPFKSGKIYSPKFERILTIELLDKSTLKTIPCTICSKLINPEGFFVHYSTHLNKAPVTTASFTKVENSTTLHKL